MTMLSATMDAAPQRSINLSLVSHTNAGKTTLVRTLLQRDVGEVRDAAHVTDVATGYKMLQAGSDTLMLWDTPGFGNTQRLVTRLRLSGNPIGWFLSQIWDRLRDRPMWSTQQALRNARDEADVILYLVNASEDPIGAAYVPLEMEVLEWVGKPIILLLNQTGPPTEANRKDEERWAAHLSHMGLVKGTLTLDAFARCWVQERTLLAVVAEVLPPEKQETISGLIAAWTERNLERHRASMNVLARELALVAGDHQEIGTRSWNDRVLGWAGSSSETKGSPQARRAMGMLAERLEKRVRDATDEIIALHGLSGQATQEVLERLQKSYTESGPAREGLAAVLGGVVSGAATGLAADAVAGGLTLGTGMIVGGILGALGAGGAARAYNVLAGEETSSVRWSDEVFAAHVRSSLLRYLAVSHFGRGRGEWEAGEHPDNWQSAVAQQVLGEDRQLRAILKQGRGGVSEEVVVSLEKVLLRASQRLLIALYPESAIVFGVTAAYDTL